MLSDHTWITLPNGPWKVQDVQAAVNVAISVLTIITAFVSIRLYWQHAATKIVAGKHVAVHSLLSIGSIGDVLDTALLLKGRLFSREYTLLLTQCVIVLAFAASSIFGGIIARYSVRRWTVIESQPVPGYLANHGFEDIGFANVQWNRTIQMLDAAKYPTDQVVDFVPQDGVPWMYQADQWNSSWSMKCEPTERTPLHFVTTNNCTTALSEAPALLQAFPTSNLAQWYQEGWGFGPSSTFNHYQFFLYGYNWTNFNSESGETFAMDFTIAAVQIAGIPSPPTDINNNCNFGVGVADEASYTRIECSLTRVPEVEDWWTTAYPDTNRPDRIAPAYAQYFQARFEEEGSSNEPISPITPYELTRFFQGYHASKDIRSREPVTRALNVEVSVVQISIIFLTIASLVTLFALLASVKIVLNWHYRRNAVIIVPQSKLEWILQSIYQSQPSGHSHVSTPISVQVPFEAMPELGRTHSCARKRHPEERQSVFGGARFGDAGVHFRQTFEPVARHAEPQMLEKSVETVNIKEIPAWNIS